MKRSALPIVVGIMVLAFCGLSYESLVRGAEGLPPTVADFAGQGSATDVVRHDEGFDRESCEIRCRSIFGIPPYTEEQVSGGAGSGSYSRYMLVANCIEKCNQRFWKEFDEKMRDIDRSGGR
jgi:hypothetical protein